MEYRIVVVLMDGTETFPPAGFDYESDATRFGQWLVDMDVYQNPTPDILRVDIYSDDLDPINPVHSIENRR